MEELGFVLPVHHSFGLEKLQYCTELSFMLIEGSREDDEIVWVHEDMLKLYCSKVHVDHLLVRRICVLLSKRHLCEYVPPELCLLCCIFAVQRRDHDLAVL